MLTEYFELQKKIYDFFGYVENRDVIPLHDSTSFFWRIDEEGIVCFAQSISDMESQDGSYFEEEISSHRFLPRLVYRESGYTMICCDAVIGDNYNLRSLRVFDDLKEVKE